MLHLSLIYIWSSMTYWHTLFSFKFFHKCKTFTYMAPLYIFFHSKGASCITGRSTNC